MIIPSARRALPSTAALAAAVVGAIAAWYYYRLDLTLSHYDARGHLVVARRIFDSLTPGWQQIGAVWLPLPHLLNALPVQIDFFYRTGLSGVAISVAAFAVATGAIAWIVLAVTGSPLAAAGGAAVFALNPNVLYLQATPMTEPLLLALTTVAVARLMNDTAVLTDGAPALVADQRPGMPRPAAASGMSERRQVVGGIAFALACLTRYEAWPVTAAALAAALLARWRAGEPIPRAVRAVARVAIWPALAIAGFMVFSRIVIGQWFVASGFFVPENKALHAPVLAAREIGWGVRAMSGTILVAAGIAGTAVTAIRALVNSRRAHTLVAVSLGATAALPWAAFVDGHPYRIRYMVPLIAMEAVGAGILAGSLGRLRTVAAIVLFALVAYELRPLDRSAPMVVEAQWDRPNVAVRARVTACLGPPGSGTIMASMGSLGHYMQEASREGFAIRDFLHEGNGDLWLAALENPRPYAAWILIEEKAEGGDMLARIARRRPSFLAGYDRVCGGAGLALYRREADQKLKLTVNR